MKIGNIVIDCRDPDRAATFWAPALGYDKREYPAEMRQALLDGGLSEAELSDRALAEDPEGQGPRLFFQRVAEPKTVKNRLHLDVNAVEGRRSEPAEVDAEMERLQALGARLIRKNDGAWGPYPEYFYVMADPEGNEFCVH